MLDVGGAAELQILRADFLCCYLDEYVDIETM